MGHRYVIVYEVRIEWTGSPSSPISILKLERSTSYP